MKASRCTSQLRFGSGGITDWGIIPKGGFRLVLHMTRVMVDANVEKKEKKKHNSITLMISV
jgi:hypothetical protein